MTLYNCVSIIIIFTITLFMYKWIILPVNWVEDLTDVGYENVFYKNNKIRKNKKAAYINNIQQRRKIGNIPPVYPNGWYALLESCEVSKGHVQYVSALDENFAVIRDINGNVHVLDAYCPHLGANIAIGGVVRNNCIECPFHGWRFDINNGQCISIPYTDKVPNQTNIKKWLTMEVNNFIYVWYHIENIDPTWYIQSNQHIGMQSKWWYRGRNELKVNCHIQEIPENGCDIAHLSSIHSLSVLHGSQHLITPSINNNIYHLFTVLCSYICQHSWSAQWARHTKHNHIATIQLQQDFQLFNKISLFHLNITVHQIGPSYVELLLNHHIGSILITQTILPEGPLLQKVIHHVYCPWYLSLIAPFVIIGETIMFKRDMTVWNHKKYLDKPFLVKGDGQIMQYRRWYQQFYSLNSKQIGNHNNNHNQHLYDW